MSHVGYSRDEYVGAAASALSDKFGVPMEEAWKLIWDHPEFRFYGHSHFPAPAMFANRVGKAAHLKARVKSGPSMESGYAYKYDRGEWDTVMVGDEEISKAKFQGFGTIDGGRVAIWKVGRSTYAQTAVGARHESNWRGSPTRSAYRAGRHGARHRIDLDEHRRLTEQALGQSLNAEARVLQLRAWEAGRSPAFVANTIRRAMRASGSPSPSRGSSKKPFVVHTKSGKIAGRYATKAEAEARIRQLKANAERLKAYRFGKR
jgi:hypothetical protein